MLFLEIRRGLYFKSIIILTEISLNNYITLVGCKKVYIIQIQLLVNLDHP